MSWEISVIFVSIFLQFRLFDGDTWRRSVPGVFEALFKVLMKKLVLLLKLLAII